MPSKASVIEFGNFIAASSSAQTADELFFHLTTSLEHHAFNKVIFSIITDKDLPHGEYSLEMIHNFSEEWLKYYVEEKLDLVDPIKKYVEIATHPFRWDDLHQFMTLSAEEINFLEKVKEVGHYNGMTIPLRGTRSQLYCLAIAASEQNNSQETHIDIINAYCQQFFLCYKRLFPEHFIETAILEKALTPKEIIVLTWVANGKTDEDVAIIMNLSRHTIDTHMRHIFQKLDVTNRIQAVVKALMLNIIQP